MSESMQKKSRFDWYTKARSRLWAKHPQGLGNVPTLAFLVGTFFLYRTFTRQLRNGGQSRCCAIYYFLPVFQNPIVLVIGIMVVLAAGIWSGGVVERTLKLQDPGIVVIDEVLGQWIALLTIQYAGNLKYTIAAFLFFRFFDIIKAPPARYFENMHGGNRHYAG